MKETIKIFFVLLFIINCLVSNTFAITNSLIGTVGNKAITNFDIVNEMKMLLLINGKTLANENKKQLQSIAMKSATERLIKQIEIEKYNYHYFNKEDVYVEIKKIAHNLNKDINQLKNDFKNYKLDFSFLENRIETELKWNGLIFDIYKNRITVNLNEIEDQLKLAQEKDFFAEYLLYEIIIDTVEKNKLQSEVNKINNEINTNGFEKTAIKFSRAESSSNGGKLGWIKETILSEEIRKIVNNTEIGSVSKPILMPEGIMFLKLADKKINEKNVDLEQIKNNLLNAEKQKKLSMFSLSHFNKLRQATAINFNIK